MNVNALYGIAGQFIPSMNDCHRVTITELFSVSIRTALHDIIDVENRGVSACVI